VDHALRLVTRHQHVEEFLADFCRVTDRNTMVLPAIDPPAIRTEVRLRIELHSGKVVLCGLVRVEQILWRRGRHAVRVRVLALDNLSQKFFRRLLRRAREATQISDSRPPVADTLVVKAAG
jgi:hypothetical protein